MATDTGYLNYILSNPDLRENAEAAGLTQAEMIVMGRTHWEGGGKNEGRLNSPDAQDFAPGFTQTLGPEHYQGRDVEDVLQASVRAGDPSEMWGAREDISPDWNLGQYTAEGWNMAADQPYGTGILANQIEVNPDIGQLVPTTAAGNVGNLNFIQDRYLDTALANDFPAEWVTNNAWTGPENLGGYWEDLTSATRDDVGILGRVDPYDPTTAARPSTVVGPRGTVTGGPPNPTVPSFGYPQYQDWTRFMPTNFQLAEGGGMHYQPWATGTPQGGGPYTVYSSCFVDGVQVELVDGSEKNVSEISVGDEVKTDKGDGIVTKIYPSKAGGQKLYGFNDKEPFVTEAHPFMTQDGWKKISEVTEGDTLYRNGKGIVTVESITSKDIPEDTPVYNFHVDGHETYFADGYLVHNKTYAPGYEPGGPNFVPGTGPGPINPNIWGNTDTTSSSNTTTDSSGNRWVMSPQGNWVPADSDYGQGLLGTGRLHPDYNFYDSSGAFVGAEGPQGDGTNSPGFSQAEIATGVAVNYGGKWGDRQMGLNMLGNMGMFGNSFGAAQPETGFGGNIEAGYNDPDIEHSGVTGAGSGGWT